MWRHVEAVYANRSTSGATRQVLLYLAHRANDNGQCWPSQATIAADVGITRRTVIRAIEALQELGEVAVIRTGNGRGNVTLYELKGDTVSPNAPVKGDTTTPINEIKGDPVSIKGDTVSIKGDIDDNRNSNKRTSNGHDYPPVVGGVRHEVEPPELPPLDVVDSGPDPHWELERVFDLRGLYVPPVSTPDYQEKWRPVMDYWLRAFSDHDLPALIGEVIDDMRGRGMTVLSPHSLRNTLPLYVEQHHARPAPRPDGPIPRIRRALEEHGANLEQWPADLQELAAPFDWSDPKFALASLSGQLTRSRA